MSSHLISLGNNRSDLQFIGDLISLCKRHNISCGDPQDLEHLASDLLFNNEFRTDLFTLCNAIGHMTEVEPSPEQLLVLVARAFGGPAVSLGKAMVDIPLAACSAFLKSYENWSTPGPDPTADSPWPIDRNQALVPPQQRPTPYAAAASRYGSDSLGPQEVPPAGHSATSQPSHRSIPPNTLLESLTLSELKMYLQEMESRVSRIEPRIEQIAPHREPKAPHREETAPHPYFSPDYFDRLDALDAQRALRAKAVAVRESEAALSPISIVPITQTEPPPIAPIAEMPPPIAATTPPPLIPYPNAIILDLPSLKQTPKSEADDARVRYLRIVNSILAFFLFIAGVSVVIFAYRYMHPAPTFDDAIKRFPVPLGGEPSSTPGPTDPTATLIQSPDAAPAVSSIPTPDNSPATTVPAETRNTHPLKRSPNASATGSKSDAHSVHQVIEQAATERPAYIVPLSPDAPAPTPANASVTVPPSMMMSYAISTPRPSYPSNGYIDQDSTVDVETTISKDGRVTNARALTGNLAVRSAAVQAVKAWRFRPFLFDGYPVTVVTTFEFVFKSK